MKRLMLALIGRLLLCVGMLAQCAAGAAPPHSLDEPMLPGVLELRLQPRLVVQL